MSGRRTGADDERVRTDGGRDPDALTDLDGIGPARADKLRDAGFESVADLRAANRADLVDVLGTDLADRVLEQVGADARTAEPDTDDAESTEGGPSVPSEEESGTGDDSGPSVPSGGESASDTSGPSVPSGGESSAGGDSGPSVPGSGESTTTVESGESSEQAGRESGATGGETGGTDSTGTATTGSGGTGTATSAQGSTQKTSDDDALLAGLVSFFVPGVGNMITGDTDRGVIILVLWIVWLIIGWGVIFLGLSFFLTAITLGLGIILVPLIGIVIGLVEFVIHVVAAIDAYRGSKVVDNVTGKVNQVRGN